MFIFFLNWFGIPISEKEALLRLATGQCMSGVLCWLAIPVWCTRFEGPVEFVCSCLIGDEFDRDYFDKIVWIWRVCSRFRLPILNFRVKIIRLCILTIAIGKIEFILLYNKHFNTLTGVIKSYSLNKASPVTVPLIMCSCWKEPSGIKLRIRICWTSIFVYSI